MAVVMRGTCSECYQTTELFLTEKQKEIVCPVCGHAVPALDSKTMQAIAKDQSKRRTFTVLAFVLFLLAVGLFVGFIIKAEPQVAGQAFVGGLPGFAKGLLGGSVGVLLVSLIVGFVASNRSYVCEF